MDLSKVGPWLKAALVRVVAVLVVLAAVQYVFNTTSRTRHTTLTHELDNLKGLNAELAQNNEQRRLQIEGIQHDDRYLEQVARQELGMIRKGEVLYRFGEPAPTAIAEPTEDP